METDGSTRAPRATPGREFYEQMHALRQVRAVVAKAVRAPSIHNSQPWRFVSTPTSLSIRADRTRQLRVIDPAARQLLISCGCALFNARVAATAAGYRPVVHRYPDPSDPDLLARIDLTIPPAGAVTAEGSGTAAARAASSDPIVRLDPAIGVRATNRRRFEDRELPAELLEVLHGAAEAEGATLVEILDPVDRSTLAQLAQRADAVQVGDPAYRAELRAWTTSDPMRLDGVSAMVVPHVDAGSGDEIPIRDFDTSGAGVLPTSTHSTRSQCLLLLGTESDDTASWVRAGEALERVLLEIARHGYTASPLTQVVEVASARAELRTELRLTVYPHILLRVGRAGPTAGTQRRHVDDVLTEALDT